MSLITRLRKKISGDVIHLKPAGKPRGNVLFSYSTYPFITPTEHETKHTNYWECKQITKTYLDLGYSVDVIDWTNTDFVPKKKYRYLIDPHANLGRIGKIINKDCIKILHVATSHWLFQNHAEYARLLALQNRRNVSLIPRRTLPPARSIEDADWVCMLGNDATADTYKFAGKPMFRIPISTTHTFVSPEHKNFENARKNFIWFGGSGMVHKGLDLTLETFSTMPEYNLSVFGPVNTEQDFENEYRKELYETPNIKTYGKIDPGSEEFKKITASSVAMVYPSCAEGQSGAVVLTMHAGLIPIVSKNSGIDTGNFGVTLQDCSIDQIKNHVRKISTSPEDSLKEMSLRAWRYANENHTREKFAARYKEFVDKIESSQNFHG